MLNHNEGRTIDESLRYAIMCGSSTPTTFTRAWMPWLKDDPLSIQIFCKSSDADWTKVKARRRVRMSA